MALAHGMNGLCMSKLGHSEAVNSAFPRVSKVSVVNEGCQQPIDWRILRLGNSKITCCYQSFSYTVVTRCGNF